MKQNLKKLSLNGALFLASIAGAYGAEVSGSYCKEAAKTGNLAQVFKSTSIVGKEFMVLRQKGQIIGAYVVSTGASRNKKTLQFPTPNGCFSSDKYDHFRNDTTPGFVPNNSITFWTKEWDQNAPLQELKGKHTERAIHDSSEVTGFPASHGCVRTTSEGVRAAKNAHVNFIEIRDGGLSSPDKVVVEQKLR